MASIRKRGSNSYLIVVSRGYDYEGNRLKSVQKTVKPPKEYTPKQAEKWVKEQAILFEREVQHTPEPINRSITLAKYIEHWVSDIGPKKAGGLYIPTRFAGYSQNPACAGQL